MHFVDLAQGPASLRSIDTGLTVSVAVDIDGEPESLLCGVQDGVTVFNLRTGQHRYVAKFWPEDDASDKARR